MCFLCLGFACGISVSDEINQDLAILTKIKALEKSTVSTVTLWQISA
jgi:hypothetical protein